MTDRTLTGVALMLGFAVTAPLIDVFSKLAAGTLPVGEVTAARFVVQGALMLPVALAMGHGAGLPRALWPLVALRAVFLVLSTYAFVSAIDVMPLADALAIVYVMPFILLVLGRVVFGEPVGRHRLGACVVGFAGCLLIIQPSLAAFGAVALWPLGTALTFAGYMVVTQRLGGRMEAVPMQLHTSLVGAGLCLPVLWLFDGSGIAALDPAWPAGAAWAWLLGTGAASAVAHLLMTLALRFAPSATLAPLNYLELVSAVVLGLLVFGDFPDALTWAGIAVVVGSGLYVIARERANAGRRAAPPRPAPAPTAAG